MVEAEFSVLQSQLPIADKLERARAELLDLSARNRLLNIPKSKTSKHIDIADEMSAQVYRLLIQEQKTLTFVPGRAGKTDDVDTDEVGAVDTHLDQPEIDERDVKGNQVRHVDTKLQTRLTPKGLQKRLLDLYNDSRTLEEEQGVNILFLALGTLKWVDPINKDSIRHAPLVLVPVTLERGAAGEKFRLKARSEELSSNLSLEAYLDKIHQLNMPAFEGGEEFDIKAYLAGVGEAISAKPTWAVQPNEIVLGFFSFAKFLMYRDLDPNNWPADAKLTEQAIVRALLGEGFRATYTLIPEDSPIDTYIPPEKMLHIVDADSSQALAVHDVRGGHNLVIQGPPGTGKSQTIANVIASAVADGKTVLFVAEKMAALDVVKRRLDAAGVGDACLELHSNKANKRSVLDELRRTWELGSPRGELPDTVMAGLVEQRDLLNGHVARLHKPHGSSELTPYQVLGNLIQLRAAGQQPTNLVLDGARTWTGKAYEQRLSFLQDLVSRIEEIGLPIAHSWWGVGLLSILPTDLDRLMPKLAELRDALQAITQRSALLAAQYEQPDPDDMLVDTAKLSALAARVATAPDLDAAALASPRWTNDAKRIQALLDSGKSFKSALDAASSWLTDSAVNTPIQGLADGVAQLPADLPPSAFEQARALQEILPRLLAEATRLGREIGAQNTVKSLAEVARLLATGERVAAAPDASPEAFAATVWEHGVEQAAELAEAVASLERLRIQIGDQLLPAAWSADVRLTRQALASHVGVLRFLSGEWRSARALSRSLLKDPATPVPQVLALLDDLSAGQTAMAKLQAGDAFGRSAFGADWRGDKSTSTPLLALVEWMRTLRGLGAEPRLVASQLTDRSGVRMRSAQLRNIFDQAGPHASALWRDLSDKAVDLLAEDVAADRVTLDAWIKCANALVALDNLLTKVMSHRPPSIDGIRDAVGQLQALQSSAAAIDDQSLLGREAFGRAYGGRASTWDQLQLAADWLQQNSDVRRLAARLTRRVESAVQTEELAEASRMLHRQLQLTADALKADPLEVFTKPHTDLISMTMTAQRLDGWIANAEQLSKWVAYQHQAETTRASGLSQLVDRLERGTLPINTARATMQMAYFEDLLRELTEHDPAIARFDGHLHSRSVQRFAELDLARIKTASLQVARAHHRRIPPRDGGAGPVGVLRGEMAKRRGHMPIRQLMQKAGPAIQAIKPVLMMSPLSVAQFLVPGRQTFDLLVMNEASQIQPVDAIGAIARCKQVVVVGDERQLPPTKFFSKMTGSVPSDDEDDTAQVTDIESILGLFVARGLPQRMLRWHYRSRHQSLIAVSNSQFYENKLYIVPSPYTQEAGMGLQFQFVPEGVFDTGGTGTNAVEARTVARAVMQHAMTQSNLSLGVATFSVAQRRAIQDELELLRRLNPEAETFFSSHFSEPFFVKNLENVQGDERDVIMISVGYAKNAQGSMAMRFGPLGADGGERRLNVLISRAKRRCVVYASITDEDIDLERAKGKGVFALKLFLQYARTGRISLAQAGQPELDSILEKEVANALQNAGYQVHPQVGIAGIFIDLAVADPDMPGRYLIGIEFDGASYSSARSARDRDRLRQAVLEDHGWIIHRIWSADWFQRPQEQLKRTIAAIENAKRGLDERIHAAGTAQRAVPVEIVAVDRGDVTEIGLADVLADGTNFYVEAQPLRHSEYELHETPVGFMSELVEQVVRVESPIHFDELVVRVRSAWGLQRAGARIEASVARALEVAHSRGAVERSGAFIHHPAAPSVMRDRQLVISQTLRKPEMIAPQEIQVGILELVAKNLGATDDELAAGVSRGLGFKSTSAGLRKSISDSLEALLRSGQLQRSHSMIVLKQ